MFFIWLGIGFVLVSVLYILFGGLCILWDVGLEEEFIGIFRGYIGRICLVTAEVSGRLDLGERSGELRADIRAMGIFTGRVQLEMAHLAYRGSGIFRTAGVETLHARLTMGEECQPRLWLRPGWGAWYEVLQLTGEGMGRSPMGSTLWGRILSRMSALEGWEADLEIHGGGAPAALALGAGALQSGLSAAEEALRLRNPGAHIRFAVHPVFDRGRNRYRSRGIFSMRMGHLMSRINAERKSA